MLCSDLELIEEFLDNDECRRRGVTSERLRENGFLRAADFDVGVTPFADGSFPTTVTSLCRRVSGL